MRRNLIPQIAVVLVVLPLSHAGSADPKRAMRVFDLRFLSDERQGAGEMPPPPVLRTDPDAGSLGVPLAVREGSDFHLSTEAVASVIREMIDPESWSNERNSIEDVGSRLAVIQTPEVLDRIDRFISGLEARAGRLLSIDIALIPPEALEKASPGALRPGAPPWLESAAFEQAVSAAGGAASVISTSARAGDPVTTEPQSTSRCLGDYEVNQTGVVPVVNPVIEDRREGAFAEITVYPAPGGWFRVDSWIGRASSRGEPERRRFAYGDLDLPREVRLEVRASLTVPEGKTAIAGSFSAPPDAARSEAEGDRPPSFCALVRVRGAPPTPEPPAEEAGLPHAFDVAILLEAPPGSRLVAPGSRLEAAEDGVGPSLDMSPEVLIETVARLFPGDPAAASARLHFTCGWIFLRGSAEEARRVRERVEALAWDMGRPVVIDLWQGVVPKEELEGAGAGALLDRSWIEKTASRGGVRARIAGATGRALSLASVSTRRYVGDLGMVSGGTGFKIATAADPVISIAGTGLLLDASSEPVAGTPWAQARLRGELARPPVFGREARARASHEVEPGATGEKAAVRPIGEWVTLELPDEDMDRWEHLVTAPQGQPVLLNALPDPSVPGATRVLIVTVTEFGLDGKPAQEGRL